MSYEGEDMDICLWMEMFIQKQERRKITSNDEMAGSKIYKQIMDKEEIYYYSLFH